MAPLARAIIRKFNQGRYLGLKDSVIGPTYSGITFSGTVSHFGNTKITSSFI
jgi:hypothetical protein